MCGVFGNLTSELTSGSCPEALTRIHHRGPDEGGWCHDGDIDCSITRMNHGKWVERAASEWPSTTYPRSSPCTSFCTRRLLRSPDPAVAMTAEKSANHTPPNPVGDMTPIRILHAVGGMNRGGVETWLMHVLRRIDRRGFKMDFVVHTSDACAYDEEIRSLGSDIIPCLHPHQPWRCCRRSTERSSPTGRMTSCTATCTASAASSSAPHTGGGTSSHCPQPRRPYGSGSGAAAPLVLALGRPLASATRDAWLGVQRLGRRKICSAPTGAVIPYGIDLTCSQRADACRARAGAG